MQRKELEDMSAVESDHWWFTGKRLFMRRLLGDHLVEKGKPLRILDVGCGTGANAVELSHYGDVTACDRSLDALGRAAGRGVRRLCVAAAPELPFAVDTFDVITAFDIIEHVEDDVGFVRELERVLAPGGRLLVRVAANDWLRGAHDRAWQVVRRYSPARLSAGLSRAGLRVERLSHANMWLFPLAAAKRLAERLAPPRSTSDLTLPFGPLDHVFGALLSSEARLIAGPGLAFGLSLIAMARKDK